MHALSCSFVTLANVDSIFASSKDIGTLSTATSSWDRKTSIQPSPASSAPPLLLALLHWTGWLGRTTCGRATERPEHVYRVHRLPFTLLLSLLVSLLKRCSTLGEHCISDTFCAPTILLESMQGVRELIDLELECTRYSVYSLLCGARQI